MKAEIEVVWRLCRLGLTISQIESLLKHARRMHRLDEATCNGTLDEVPHRKAVAEEMAQASLAIKAHGSRLFLFHQSDPRGAALYVMEDVMMSSEDSIDSVYSRGVAVY